MYAQTQTSANARPTVLPRVSWTGGLLRGPLLGIALSLFLWPAGVATAQESFSFDLDEYTKSPFSWGGLVEAGAVQQDLGQERVLYPLSFPEEEADSSLQSHLTLGLNANYDSGFWRLVWRWEGTATDQDGTADHDEVTQEAYAAYTPGPQAKLAVGKQLAKWGKGYAFNPIAFVDRPKDPDDPDAALEGFVMVNMEGIQSFDGPIQNAALTLIALPVTEDVNEDYGAVEGSNVAVKLYALVWDTDIDLAWLGEGTRSARYGADFSRNLTSAWEVHGEWARITRVTQRLVDQNGAVTTNDGPVESTLVGMRYLTEAETTLIAEYYVNGGGYTAEELENFYRFAEDTLARSGPSALPAQEKLLALRQGGYGRPTNGQRYGYVKLSQKEPFDWLYGNVSLTILQNLDDESRSVSPDVSWTGITNLEMRLKYTALVGGTYTEFGEKVTLAKLDATVAYSF